MKNITWIRKNFSAITLTIIAVLMLTQLPLIHQARAASNDPSRTKDGLKLSLTEGNIPAAKGSQLTFEAKAENIDSNGTFTWTIPVTTDSYDPEDTDTKTSTRTVTATNVGNEQTVKVTFEPDDSDLGTATVTMNVTVVDDLKIGDSEYQNGKPSNASFVISHGDLSRIKAYLVDNEDTHTVVQDGSKCQWKVNSQSAGRSDSLSAADFPSDFKDDNGVPEPDSYTVKAIYPDTTDVSAPLTATEAIKLVEVEVDLDVDSDNDGSVETDDDTEDDAEESLPGKLIAVNDNDSDGDGDKDCTDDQWDNDPDDLATMILGLDPDNLPVAHKIILSVGNDDENEIRIFDDENNAVIGPDAGATPWEEKLGYISLPAGDDIKFYVEGVTPGEATITLKYTDADGEVIASDNIKVTIVKVDLDVDSNNDGNITDVDDPGEKDGPGKIVAVNDDNDDNGDDTVDGSDRDCDDDHWDNDPEDLATMILGLDPDNLPVAHKIILSVGNDDENEIRIFDDENNAVIGPDAGATPWEEKLGYISLPAGDDIKFYVEGVTPGEATITLKYTDADGEVIASDKIKVTVVDVNFDSLSPTTICAAGTDQAAGTSLAKATVTPTGRELKWELLNNGDVEATMMDADGNTSQSSLETASETVLVTAGNQGGTVIAQVSDAVLKSFQAV